MKPLHEILRRPVITEKTSFAKEANRVVVFEVARGANKIEIKRAVEQAFEVKVKEVNTVQMAGKVKRRGQTLGKRTNFKKAYVTLEEGSNIDFFGV